MGIPALLTIASTAFGAMQSMQAGKAEESAMKHEAKQAEASAKFQTQQAEADAKAEKQLAQQKAEKIRKAAKAQQSSARAASAASGMDIGIIGFSMPPCMLNSPLDDRAKMALVCARWIISATSSLTTFTSIASSSSTPVR